MAKDRNETRVNIEMDVDYASVDSFSSDYALNISQGGLFIFSRNPPPLGSDISLKVRFPDMDLPLELTGTVKWINKDDKKSSLIPGMGIEFTNLTEKTKKAIQDFITKNS